MLVNHDLARIRPRLDATPCNHPKVGAQVRSFSGPVDTTVGSTLRATAKRSISHSTHGQEKGCFRRRTSPRPRGVRDLACSVLSHSDCSRLLVDCSRQTVH